MKYSLTLKTKIMEDVKMVGMATEYNTNANIVAASLSGLLLGVIQSSSLEKEKRIWLAKSFIKIHENAPMGCLSDDVIRETKELLKELEANNHEV
jgi:hypothetical protein